MQISESLFNVINSTIKTEDVSSGIFNTINGIETIQNSNIFQTINASSYESSETKTEVSFDPVWINTYFQANNERIKEVVETIVDEDDSDDIKMEKIQKWVVENLEYVEDKDNYGYEELWVPPTMSLDRESGDCIANYEKIWTKDGLKTVGDLAVGDKVLSYDFNKKKYCYRPIIQIWEKGELEVFRVTFGNGTWIDVTKDHPFWTRRTQKQNPYVKTKLCDIDMERWWKKKIPCAKKLPYEVKDIDWLTEDLCFVIGHFLAEGWSNRGGTYDSGYDMLDSIYPILDNHKIPYSHITDSANDLPIIIFLKSKFQLYLSGLKTTSLDINIYEELLCLPETKLEALLEGMFVGDGHYSRYDDKRGYDNNKEKTYSTSSEQLAKDIQRIHLQLGKPIYMWLQEDNGVLGNNPIWRLSYNSKSHFSKDFGYNGLSEVSIKSIESIGTTTTRDFEVLQTHTFISEFGHLTHNCEDGAFLIVSLALNAGVDEDRLRFYGGYVDAGPGAAAGGHGWAAYKRETDDEWVAIDWCYYPDEDVKMGEKTPLRNNLIYQEDYFFFTTSVVVQSTENTIRNPDIYLPDATYGNSQANQLGWLVDSFI